MSRYALTEVVSELVGQPIRETSVNVTLHCPLPGHVDSHPSFRIHLDKGVWVCLSCGERGGMQRLADLLDQPYDELDVLVRTVGRYDIPEHLDFSAKAAQMNENGVSGAGEAAIDRYIMSRGLSFLTYNKFSLGWDGERISMPYYDDERCFAIKYRYPDGRKEAEKGSKRGIYNVNDARVKPFAVICEGESDTHRMWTEVHDREQESRIAVVGVPGATVTREQWDVWSLNFLWSRRVALCFDADDAGRRGAAVAQAALGDKAFLAIPTHGKDICEHFVNGGGWDELGLRGLATDEALV